MLGPEAALAGGAIGPYRLLSDLGTGGMGRVFLAEGEGGQRVALKIVHPHLLERPGYRERFLREVEMGMRVVHKNVVRTLDAGTALRDGKPVDFMAMEYVQGQTLRALLDELWRVPEPLCRHVGREIAQGLEAIHAAGILHRDLRPENVLITREHAVKIMDLGVARLVEESARLSQSGMFVGSVAYAAPEQIQGGGRGIDQRVDLYALGMVLYELGCGRHPFPEEEIGRALHRQLHEDPAPPSRVEPTLTPFYDEVVLTLLARAPDERFPTASAVRVVLAEGEVGAWWRDRAQRLRARTRRPLRRPAREAAPAFVGRTAEMSTLRRLTHLAGLSRGQVALVVGEPGIGKSRLLQEFADQLDLEADGPHVLLGGYPPGGAATASGAFSTAYREHLGAEGLEESLRRVLRPLPRLVPAFAAVLRGDVLPPETPPLARDSLQAAFVQVTRALAAERPTVVLIDDLDLAPSEGRALFAALAHAVREQRVLLVGAGRKEALAAWAADLAEEVPLTQLPLERLTPEDLRLLLARLLGSEPLARDLAGPVGGASAGNPRFALEIVRSLEEAGVLVQGPGGAWTTTSAVAGRALPSSLAGLVAARLAALPPDQRALLEAAASAGYAFDPLEAAAAARVDRLEALQRLRTIEQEHGLVRARGEHYVFDHPQVRDALLAGLAPALRRELDAGVLRVLEEREARRLDASDGSTTVRLAEHALRAGEGPRALPWLRRAVEHLEHSHLADAATSLVALALDAPGLLQGRARAQALLAQARRLEQLGRPAAVRAALAEAQALAVAAEDRLLEAEVEDLCGWHALGAGAYGPARAALERALALAREAAAPHLEARALAHRGDVERDQGDLDAAQQSYEQALATAHAVGDGALERSVLRALGTTRTASGRFEAAREDLARHVAGCVAAGDRHGTVAGRLALGEALEGLGEWTAARGEYEQAWSRAREIGYRREEDTALAALGRLLGRLGEPEEARRHLERALALARETGDRATEARARYERGVVDVESGAAEAGRAHLREALDAWTALEVRDGEVAARLALARATRATDPDGARAELLRVVERVAGTPLEPAGALARCLLATLPGGDVAAARAALGRHGARLALHERIEAHLSLGEVDGAPADLSAARRLLDDLLERLPTVERARVALSPLARRVRAGATSSSA